MAQDRRRIGRQRRSDHPQGAEGGFADKDTSNDRTRQFDRYRLPARRLPDSRWARSVSSTATSAPARCTRSRKPSVQHGVVPTPDNVLGILSLMFWSLILVVSIKYASVHHARRQQGRGRHHGAAALAQRSAARQRARRAGGSSCSACSARRCSSATACITPAISVLSARSRAWKSPRRRLRHWVVPITCVIIVLLFAFQRHGTGQGRRVFGPVMVVWFITLAVLGLVRHRAASARAARAVSPSTRIEFFLRNRWSAFFVLGTVVLAVTGAEALYADMGHFGKSRSACLVRLRAAGAGAQLLRPGRAGAARSATASPIRSTCCVPLRAAVPDDRAGDGRDGDRLAGGDLGRVLGDPRGDPARLPAAHGGASHLGEHTARSTCRGSTACCWC